MSPETRPPFWQLVKAAAEDLGGKTTNVAVRDWILERYPDANRNTIAAQITICTVNSPSRIHYPENQRPRTVDGTHRWDSLFRPERGKLELFDAERHGLWELDQREDGKLEVRQATDEPVPDQGLGKEGEAGHAFAAEPHLRDYLVQHLDLIEDGLQLFVDDEGNSGVEYRIPVGRIDILAVDAEGGFVVIELKVGRGPDAVCGQVMRYVSWVKRHLAQGRQVRGCIITHHISDKIRYGVADVPDVFLREYELSLVLHDVPPIDADA